MKLPDRADNKSALKYEMDKAITNYIVACTGADPADIDFSEINQDIKFTITVFGGQPAKED